MSYQQWNFNVKYLTYKDKKYRPVIFQYEYNGSDRAWYAAFACENSKLVNNTRVLFYVRGRYLLEAVELFEAKFNQLVKYGIIKDYLWYGWTPSFLPVGYSEHAYPSDKKELQFYLKHKMKEAYNCYPLVPGWEEIFRKAD